MMIKYPAFSSFYHKQNFNYLRQNCQCLASPDIRTPTIKNGTTPYIFLAGVYELLSKIPE